MGSHLDTFQRKVLAPPTGLFRNEFWRRPLPTLPPAPCALRPGLLAADGDRARLCQGLLASPSTAGFPAPFWACPHQSLAGAHGNKANTDRMFTTNTGRITKPSGDSFVASKRGARTARARARFRPGLTWLCFCSF